MAQDLNDFMNSLGDRGSTAPAKPSWHGDTPAPASDLNDFMNSLGRGKDDAPSAGSKGLGTLYDPKNEADEPGYMSVLRAPSRAAYGAAKLLGGMIPGAAELVPGLGQTAPVKAASDWARAPSTSWAESIGGPVMAGLATGGAGLAARAAEGAIVGGLQPTEEGTFLSHLPGAAIGAVTGGILPGGSKAAKQATLKGFNKAALEAVVEPFNKHWPGGARPPLNDIGSKGVKEVQDWIQHAKNSVLNPKTPNKKQLTTDIADAEERLSRFLDASTRHYVDPQSLLDHFERPGNKTITSHILKDLAEKGRRAGVPPLNPSSRGRSWMSAPLAWGLSHTMGVPHAAVHAGLAGLHGLSRQATGQSIMDELSWLARNAERYRRFARVPATAKTSQTAEQILNPALAQIFNSTGASTYGSPQDSNQQ